MTVEFGVLLPTREAVMSGRMETAPLLHLDSAGVAGGASCRRPVSYRPSSIGAMQ